MALRYRAYGADGDVLHSGAAPSAKAEFTTEEHIDKIVFYDGPKASEVVVGSCRFGGSGKVSVRFDAEKGQVIVKGG